MPFPSLVCAVLETTINQLLKLDRSASIRFAPLSGKAIKLTLREFSQPLYFFFSSKQVEILGDYEGDLDVEFTVETSAITQLQDSAKISELIKSEQLIITGDITLLQQFADLLIKLDIDWAEHLSHYTGDVFAHRATTIGQKALTKIKSVRKEKRDQLSEYITEELKLAPGRLEFIHFSDQVSELDRQVADIEQRIKKLR